MPALPPYRLWFLSATGARLVQLQADLLALNWRRTVEDVVVDDDYPRYTTLRAISRTTFNFSIRQHWRGVVGPLLPNWCEVTYINQISPLGPDKGRPKLSDVLRGVEMPRPVASSRAPRTPASTSGSLFLARIIRAAGSPSRWCRNTRR